MFVTVIASWQMVASASATTNVDAAYGRPLVVSTLDSASARAVHIAAPTRRTHQWVYVDLGAKYKIHKVVLNWVRASVRRYEVQISSDARHWTTIYSTRAGGRVNRLRGLSGTGRYVRIYRTGHGARRLFSLRRVSVYGTRVRAKRSSGVTRPDPVASISSSGASSVTTPGIVQPFGSVPGSWTKVTFDDEFTSPERWGSVWAQDRGGPQGQMNDVTTDPNNVTVSGGVLSLKLASSGEGALVSTFADDGGGGFMMGYGYAEARIFLPQAGGKLIGWPAWWIDGTNWPEDGEADIVEGLDGAATSNYHYSLNGTEQTNNSPTIPGTWGGGWHTYGIDREPGENFIYWDGRLVRSYRTFDNGAPQGLILNIGSSSVESYPAVMQVDYVRVWQH